VWFQRAGLTIAIAGGAAMLTGAAAAHGAASVPLVVIGSGWLAIGALGLRRNRNCANQVRIDGTTLTFTGATQPQEFCGLR
jgi:hypothetical protein